MIKLYSVFNHWKNFNCIWGYSDPHFEDKDCLLMHPNWPSPEEQVKLINSKVGKKDLVIFLGDIGNKEWIKKIKGYKVLICGNHDKGASNYKRKVWTEKVDINAKREDMGEHFHHFENEISATLSTKDANGNIVHKPINFKTAVYDNGLFDEVYEGPLFINEKILLSHEPINLPFGINIHGHCHGKPSQGASINLCSDVNDFTPKRLDHIIEGIKSEDVHRLAIDRAIERKYY